MAKKKKPLSAKHLRFCHEYIKDLNGTQAAIRAGYSVKTAGAQAYDFLRKPEILGKIQELQDAQVSEAEYTAKQILAEIDSLAMSDFGVLANFAGKRFRFRNACDIPPSATKWIQSMRVRPVFKKVGDKVVRYDDIEIKLWSKTEMLRLGALRRSLLIEKHEVTGKDGGPIQTIEVVQPPEQGHANA